MFQVVFDCPKHRPTRGLAAAGNHAGLVVVTCGILQHNGYAVKELQECNVQSYKMITRGEMHFHGAGLPTVHSNFPTCRPETQLCAAVERDFSQCICGIALPLYSPRAATNMGEIVHCFMHCVHVFPDKDPQVGSRDTRVPRACSICNNIYYSTLPWLSLW